MMKLCNVLLEDIMLSEVRRKRQIQILIRCTCNIWIRKCNVVIGERLD